MIRWREPPQAWYDTIQAASVQLMTLVHQQLSAREAASAAGPFGLKLSVRKWLLVHALAVALPVLVFAGIAAHALATAERQATLTELEHRTEAVANKVERYLQSLQELAVTLANSPSVLAGELPAFYDFAKRAMAAGNVGRNIVLVDTEGRQLVNTRLSFGEVLPAAGDVQGVAEAVARKAPQFSNLFKGAVATTHVFTVWAPVVRDGQVVSLVGVTVEPQDLTAVLREERLREGWVGALIDRAGIIVARTLAPESMVGQPVMPEAAKAQAQGMRGAYSLVMKEGLAASAYFIKLPASRWTVAIGLPERQLEAAARNSLQVMFVLGLAALAAAGALAYLLGRHMSGQIAGVARAAAAVGDNREPANGRSSVTELDQVFGALHVARGLIDTREAALRESEARLRSILETANVMAWEAEFGTEVVHTIGPGARLFNRPEGSRMENRDEFLAGIAAEDRDRVLAGFEAAARSGQPYGSEFRVPLDDGSVRWIGTEAAVEQACETRPTRMRGITFDITKRKLAELALEDAIRVTAVACEAGHMGTWHRDILANRLDFSDELLDLIGIARDQWGGTPEALEPFMHPEDIERRRRERALAESSGKAIDLDFRIFRPDGQLRWLQSRGRIERRSDGSASESFGVMIDITDRKLAEEHQQMLIAELDHRVKNVLARVAVVARCTREGSTSLGEFLTAFEGRIAALAHTHSLLSRSRWTGASLGALVREELAPYATTGNTAIDGPEVTLSADAAQTVATVLHELATNAGKYGALSTSTGRVAVSWTTLAGRKPDPVLALDWVESGGPTVAAPTRSGYGSSVIREQIPYELGGDVELSHAPEGVRCRIEFPLSHLSKSMP